MAATVHSGGVDAGSGTRPRQRANEALEPVVEHADLAFVMSEIADMMGAGGAVVTMHPAGDRAAELVFADHHLREDGTAQQLLAAAAAARIDFDDDHCIWRDDLPRDGHAALFMPIRRKAGHSRLVLAMLFAAPTEATRQRAERLYAERKPFAIGYFQLWQQNRMLAQRTRALEAVLEQTAIGVILLDQRGHVAFTNHTANEILARGDGLGRSNGALRASHLGDGVNLHAALSHALTNEHPTDRRDAIRAPLLAFRRRTGPPLVSALLAASEPATEPSDVAAIMYIVDPQLDTEKMLSPLCRLYGLSPVETSLACHLARGETLATSAEAMHVKEQTARSYLKTIFIKTGTRRQTELVVLMLSSLIRMKRDILQEALTSGASDLALGLK